MLTFRHLGTQDFERVRELHAAQGLDYELPNLDSPTMLIRDGLEENGVITHALLARKTCEVYWLFDPKRPETRRERIGRLGILQKEGPREAKLAGFEDAHLWLPPHLAADVKMTRLLERLGGWQRAPWPCFYSEVR